MPLGDYVVAEGQTGQPMMRHQAMKKPGVWIARWVLSILFLAVSASVAHSREVTDIFGNKVIVPDLPRNAMGKVQKADLRRELCQRQDVG